MSAIGPTELSVIEIGLRADHHRRDSALSRLAELVAPARLGRSFRWLLASSWVTNLGDGITLAAGPLLVASQTHNPLAVAMAALLQRLPWLIFGLYAGVVADRLSRRAIVITTITRPKHITPATTITGITRVARGHSRH